MQFCTRHDFILQWLILLAVTSLMVCPVPASFLAGNTSVPAQQDPESPIITVVSGTTHNATVIRVMTARACTPVSTLCQCLKVCGIWYSMITKERASAPVPVPVQPHRSGTGDPVHLPGNRMR